MRFPVKKKQCILFLANCDIFFRPPPLWRIVSMWPTATTNACGCWISAAAPGIAQAPGSMVVNGGVNRDETWLIL